MEVGFSPAGNSCSHSHSFWEVVNFGQEMSWHFGLEVVTLLSPSEARESWTKVLSCRDLGHSACGGRVLPGYVEFGLERPVSFRL